MPTWIERVTKAFGSKMVLQILVLLSHDSCAALTGISDTYRQSPVHLPRVVTSVAQASQWRQNHQRCGHIYAMTAVKAVVRQALHQHRKYKDTQGVQCLTEFCLTANPTIPDNRILFFQRPNNSGFARLSPQAVARTSGHCCTIMFAKTQRSGLIGLAGASLRMGRVRESNGRCLPGQ